MMIFWHTNSKGVCTRDRLEFQARTGSSRFTLNEPLVRSHIPAVRLVMGKDSVISKAL